MTYGLDVQQFRRWVVIPTLQHMNLSEFETLILGTALQESKLIDVHQLGVGPALGVCQMELNTHQDIWLNFLAYHSELHDPLIKLIGYLPMGEIPDATEMCGNLNYAVAMCAVHYRRKTYGARPMRLPASTDAQGMAEVYKQYYNGPGAATVAQALPHFQYAVQVCSS